MLKTVFIRDLLAQDSNGTIVELQCWLKARREHSRHIFINLVDSTGTIQSIIDKRSIDGQRLIKSVKTTPLESAVKVKGELKTGQNGQPEIFIKDFIVIGKATLDLSPQPRSDFDVFDEALASHLMKHRAVYLRNPKTMNVLRCRSELMRIVRDWFYAHSFMEFDAPILTPAPLYDDSTAMGITVHKQSLFLTQCAGFYLEAAAHAFERVFNMGPSFRGEESRSKRHLKEYWHIKAELAFGNRDDIISIVESLLADIYPIFNDRCTVYLEQLGKTLNADDFTRPYPRISYADAVKELRKMGREIEFGAHVSSDDETALSSLFNKPFWIVGIPRSVEPFPYVIDEVDPRVTMVADLIAPRGYGELCGVAEKIFDPVMLEERLAEKDKLEDLRYNFVKEVHLAGCVPHIAFGMGLERLLRWLLDIPHVRDTIPFPRPAGREIEH